MFCRHCGAEVAQGNLFCENCGQPVSAAAPPPAQGPQTPPVHGPQMPPVHGPQMPPAHGPQMPPATPYAPAKKPNTMVIALCAVVALGAVGTGVYFALRKPEGGGDADASPSPAATVAVSQAAQPTPAPGQADGQTSETGLLPGLNLSTKPPLEGGAAAPAATPAPASAPQPSPTTYTAYVPEVELYAENGPFYKTPQDVIINIAHFYWLDEVATNGEEPGERVWSDDIADFFGTWEAVIVARTSDTLEYYLYACDIVPHPEEGGWMNLYETGEYANDGSFTALDGAIRATGPCFMADAMMQIQLNSYTMRGVVWDDGFYQYLMCDFDRYEEDEPHYRLLLQRNI